MTKADDHAEKAVKAYAVYWIKQKGIADFEKDMLERAGRNRLIASLRTRDQQYYRLAVNSRNAIQDKIRTEASMAAIGLLMDIRSLLRDIAAKLDPDNKSRPGSG